MRNRTPPPRREIPPEEVAAYLEGFYTLAEASKKFALPRHHLRAAVAAGRIRAKVRDERGTLILLAVDVARYAAGLPDAT